MSYEYDQYLREHKANVLAGFNWMKENMPQIIYVEPTPTIRCVEDLEWQIKFGHDASKTQPDEYEAYDAYFYGNNKSFAVKEAFNKAWLAHIHRNPHHWQYWLLINDEAEEGTTVIDMPDNYIIEMICDWWSFSWKTDNLYTIFDWYKEHKNIKLGPKTKQKVEEILNIIKEKLDDQNLVIADINLLD